MKRSSVCYNQNAMTELLQRAFDRASRLPQQQQDEFARLMLAELDSEQRWQELFALPDSEELLDRMADEALEAHRTGLTKPMDPDEP